MGHKEIKTEIYILRLIHAQAMKHLGKNYQKALKIVRKYKKISPRVDPHVYKLYKDIPLHVQGQDLLLNGLRYASKKKSYTPLVRRNGKVTKLEGPIRYRQGLINIKPQKKVIKFPMYKLTVTSLKQIFDDGMRVKIPEDQRYYEIGLYLLYHKEFSEALKAFDKCGQKEQGTIKSE